MHGGRLGSPGAPAFAACAGRGAAALALGATKPLGGAGGSRADGGTGVSGMHQYVSELTAQLGWGDLDAVHAREKMFLVAVPVLFPVPIPKCR